MTHWTKVSSTTLPALAAWVCAAAFTMPAAAQLDQGIAPNTQQRPQRPQNAATVLIGDPSAPLKTADATGVKAPGLGQSNKKLQDVIPPNFQPDPRLEKCLTDWEEHTKGVQRLHGAFWVYTYDMVFQSETRAVGKFWYQSPDKGRMDFQPVDLDGIKERNKANEPINPKKKAPDGTPFVIKPRDAEVWNCNGSEILQIFPPRKEYNRVGIPQQYQGESIKESPLPFLFGLRKAEAQERYFMQLGNMHDQAFNGGKSRMIHVIALPLREQDSREWSKAEVLLDGQSFLPISILTIDPAGTSENVYRFADVEVNARWLFKDPFTLNVSGLKLIHDRSAEPPQNIPSGVAPKAPAAAAPVKKPLFNLGAPK